MSEPQREQIEQAIASYHDLYVETDLKSAKAIKSIEIEAGRVKVEVTLGFPAAGHRSALAGALGERDPRRRGRRGRGDRGRLEGLLPRRPAGSRSAEERPQHRRRRLRQGRGRQVHRRRQPGSRALGRRRDGRGARRRHLRPEPAADAGCAGPARLARRQVPGAHDQLPHPVDVDRLPHRGRHPDDLARGQW